MIFRVRSLVIVSTCFLLGGRGGKLERDRTRKEFLQRSCHAQKAITKDGNESHVVIELFNLINFSCKLQINTQLAPSEQFN